MVEDQPDPIPRRGGGQEEGACRTRGCEGTDQAALIFIGGRVHTVNARNDYAPLFRIEQALTRATMDGDVSGADERVDLTTAIRMHTINGAHGSFDDQRKGGLEPGKLAGLVLLDEDLARVPAAKIHQVGIVMTVVGGQVVSEA